MGFSIAYLRAIFKIGSNSYCTTLALKLARKSERVEKSFKMNSNQNRFYFLT
jgi:hypothetical protein